MHSTQKQLLDLSGEYNFGGMTLREIGELVGESHPQKIKHHLDQLKKKGFIREGMSGSIQPAQKASGEFIHIPLVGRANCGEALSFAEEDFNGYLTVSRNVVPRSEDLYAVRAVGDSMNEAQATANKKAINDGDYAIIDPRAKVPKDGDYVLSVIDGSANIKKFYKDGDQIILRSESSRDYPPIVIHKKDYDQKYMIAGEIVGVIKGI
jgi:repressor LexA